MRRTDEDHDVERSAAKEPVGVGGDRARVHQPGVGRDERHEIAIDVACRRRQMSIHGRGEGVGRAWIPASGDCRSPDSAGHFSHVSIWACRRNSAASRSPRSRRWRNLELEQSELDQFAKQLSEILAYAEEVQRVDTAGVPPTASTS